jgi:hypothetical protein
MVGTPAFAGDRDPLVVNLTTDASHRDRRRPFAQPVKIWTTVGV